MLTDKIIESGILPDSVLRYAVRQGLRRYQQRLKKLTCDDILQAQTSFKQKSLSGSIALSMSEANDQHYEVPIEFFEMILGKYMKYSSGLMNSKSDSLKMLEKKMLDCAAKLDFETAAKLRDEINRLKAKQIGIKENFSKKIKFKELNVLVYKF